MKNFMLKIPDELHRELKVESVKTNVTMTKIILDGLLKELKERKKLSKHKKPPWGTVVMVT